MINTTIASNTRPPPVIPRVVAESIPINDLAAFNDRPRTDRHSREGGIQIVGVCVALNNRNVERYTREGGYLKKQKVTKLYY
ncbi:MAG: hypothetical protein LBO72_03355 [Helicobacteraceae bacterium]|nr:hypothetical protein [Helicobacteraceae bacterium]